LREFLEAQGRFRHLLSEENQQVVARMEKEIESREKELLVRAGEGKEEKEK